MSLSESFSGELPESIVSRPVPVQSDIVERLAGALDGVMSIDEVKRIDRRRQSAIVFKGTLLGDAEALYPLIADRFKTLGYTAALQREGKADVALAVEGLLVARGLSSPGWVHALLLLLTIFTTTMSGAA